MKIIGEGKGGSAENRKKKKATSEVELVSNWLTQLGGDVMFKGKSVVSAGLRG